MKLNVGCGRDWRDHQGFVGVDIVDFGQEYVRDIEKEGLSGIADNSVQEIICHNVLEHIRSSKKIFVMNEMHRVMQKGGVLDIIVPRFPHYAAVADPTHLSFWHEKSFEYFAGKRPRNADYGIRKWAIENDGKGNYTWKITENAIFVRLIK